MKTALACIFAIGSLFVYTTGGAVPRRPVRNEVKTCAGSGFYPSDRPTSQLTVSARVVNGRRSATGLRLSLDPEPGTFVLSPAASHLDLTGSKNMLSLEYELDFKTQSARRVEVTVLWSTRRNPLPSVFMVPGGPPQGLPTHRTDPKLMDVFADLPLSPVAGRLVPNAPIRVEVRAGAIGVIERATFRIPDVKAFRALQAGALKDLEQRCTADDEDFMGF